ncbi:methyltransferase, TIGR04325 family [Sphingomonas psychrotolerans]|nr:methyltransferase, TIGR04325 family [Sphingomonas psychrotolerans]
MLAGIGGSVRYRGRYASFAQARAHSLGYENPLSLQRGELPALQGPITEARTLQLVAAFAPIVAARANLRVVDLGGSLGGHYYSMARLFPQTDWDWTVVETPAQVAAARTSAPVLHFATERPQGHFDIALISGTLQYLPDPYAVLRDFAAHADYVVLNRLPVAAEDIATVQVVKGQGSYPALLPGERKLMNALAELGEIVMQWECPADQISLGASRVRHRGFLLRVHQNCKETTRTCVPFGMLIDEPVVLNA